MLKVVGYAFVFSFEITLSAILKSLDFLRQYVRILDNCVEKRLRKNF